MPLPDYAELHCISNFTFLRGASHPEQLIRQAVKLGYKALALTDECSLAGVVRAHIAARGTELKLIIGSEFCLSDGLRLILLATNRASYGHLSKLISHARANSPKGKYRLSRGDLEAHTPLQCIALWLTKPETDRNDGNWLKKLFPNKVWIAVELHLSGNDRFILRSLEQLSAITGIPLVASGDVHMHRRSQRIVQDTLSAIRLGKPLPELGYALFANGERHLRSRARLARFYPRALLEETIKIAGLAHFSLDELRYEYPDEIVPKGHTPTSWLGELTWRGARHYWPGGIPKKVRRLLEHELALIAELDYEPYFLTVYDIVRFAREQDILCQGRGSAANSAVCYCLGITAVDPSRMNMLMARFISRERNEPPDIDVDFEHRRREEVIQYIYRRYGRNRAAIAATVTTYRWRSAVRDIGKALGLTLDQIERIASQLYFWDGAKEVDQRLLEAGFDPENPQISQLLTLAHMIQGFPRHLSQHTGGFVIARDDLAALVPIENAAMPDRTVIQWDKDDLDALGLIKVDVLALGMLTAIHKAFDLIACYRGHQFGLTDIPPEDTATYTMIQQADTVGVFQIESRAQMTMLPRLKPENYYDLVIEVAIIRPGPISGNMVHPYLKRRTDPSLIDYPNQALRPILERTLGIPIFQEQVMQIAMVAADFTPGEADQLRRSMAAWKKRGGMEPFKLRLLEGMRKNGYNQDFAERICEQIKGFGSYGFPESHAASFALISYISAWLKCHEPAAFCCALLNSQPMGFYAPAQLIQDVRRHGVEVRPVDVRYSQWESSLEVGTPNQQPSIRLGLGRIKGLHQETGKKIVTERNGKPYDSLADLVQRCDLQRPELEILAAADAFRGLSGHRHLAHWDIAGIEQPLPLFGHANVNEARPLLRKPSDSEDMFADYATQGLSLKHHPLSLLRSQLDEIGICPAQKLIYRRNGSIVKVAGLVTNRQRPSTASGVIFVTLEDETGFANLIVWPKIAEVQRVPLLASKLMLVFGTLQKENNVIHVIAGKIRNCSHWLEGLKVHSRDFH